MEERADDVRAAVEGDGDVVDAVGKPTILPSTDCDERSDATITTLTRDRSRNPIGTSPDGTVTATTDAPAATSGPACSASRASRVPAINLTFV